MGASEGKRSARQSWAVNRARGTVPRRVDEEGLTDAYPLKVVSERFETSSLGFEPSRAGSREEGDFFELERSGLGVEGLDDPATTGVFAPGPLSRPEGFPKPYLL